MLRDNRVWYATIVKSSVDLLSKQNVVELFKENHIEKVPSKNINKNFISRDYRIYCEEQYSSDRKFIETKYSSRLGGYAYNISISKIDLLRRGRSKDIYDSFYIIASPLKRLSAKVFSNLKQRKIDFDFTFYKPDLKKILYVVEGKLGEEESMKFSAEVPTVDFFVYGDGGSDDIKISGSDPLHSTVYKSIREMDLSSRKNIRIAPCSALIIGGKGFDYGDWLSVYFKGVISYLNMKNNYHQDMLLDLLAILNDCGCITETKDYPSWMSEKNAKKYLLYQE